MTTTITKKVKGIIMEKLFERRDLINIRYVSAKNLKDDKEYNENNFYLYEIKIRHNEDEKAKDLLINSIKQISNDTIRKNPTT